MISLTPVEIEQWRHRMHEYADTLLPFARQRLHEEVDQLCDLALLAIKQTGER